MNASIYPLAGVAFVRDGVKSYIVKDWDGKGFKAKEQTEVQIGTYMHMGIGHGERSINSKSQTLEEVEKEVEFEVKCVSTMFNLEINLMMGISKETIKGALLEFIEERLAEKAVWDRMVKIFYSQPVPQDAKLEEAKAFCKEIGAKKCLEFWEGLTNKKPFAVAFTGHRPDRLGGYDKNDPMNKRVCAFLRTAIERLRDEGYREFISGAALGVDQWAAEVVIELGLDLTIALPFADYGNNWPAESERHLAAIMAKAKKIHIVCEGPYAPWKNHKRNEWMGDNSGVCVAVWNGARDGGTASAVRYNKKIGNRFVRYNPKTDAEEPV